MTGDSKQSGRLRVQAAPLVTLVATCDGRWTWARFCHELCTLVTAHPLPSGTDGVVVVDVRGARFAPQGFIAAMHMLRQGLAARRYQLVLLKADWLVRGMYDAYLDAFPEQNAPPPICFFDESAHPTLAASARQALPVHTV